MTKSLRLLLLFVMLAMTLFSGRPVESADWQAKVDPALLPAAGSEGDPAQSQGATEFIVFLNRQADLSGAAGLATKLEKGRFVYEQLTKVAGQTQPEALHALDAQAKAYSAAGLAPVEYRAYWIANMIWVRGDLALVEAMARRGDVSHIYANPTVHLDLPEQPSQADVAPQNPQAVEWNLLKVQADKVWALGIRGEGVVIGGQDTGYAWDHPAIKNQYRGWNGSSADHNYNWHDAIHAGAGSSCGVNSPYPCDDYGHGTHTMGTMVGDDGGANQIGMAPKARWIGCRNMNSGNGTPVTYAECYQWFIAPTDLNDQNPQPDLAPDVISNSWSCPTSEGCTDPTVLLSAVNAVRAAGIVTVHSAGNSGSACFTVNQPGGIYDASFTVGATDNGDNIAGFSSRGPVTVDGSGRMKPDISAPGVSIRSSVPLNFYASGYGNMDGTSMAAPHVAGLVALMISADPSLAGDVDRIEQIIRSTALPCVTSQSCGVIPGSQSPNNTYGWGRIDALKAVQAALDSFSLSKTVSLPYYSPGDVITYTLQIRHESTLNPTTNVVLSDTIPTGSTFLSASSPFDHNGSVITWSFPSIEAGGVRVVQLAVHVAPSTSGPLINQTYGVSSADVARLPGTPVVILPRSAMILYYIPWVKP